MRAPSGPRPWAVGMTWPGSAPAAQRRSLVQQARCTRSRWSFGRRSHLLSTKRSWPTPMIGRWRFASHSTGASITMCARCSVVHKMTSGTHERSAGTRARCGPARWWGASPGFALPSRLGKTTPLRRPRSGAPSGRSICGACGRTPSTFSVRSPVRDAPAPDAHRPVAARGQAPCRDAKETGWARPAPDPLLASVRHLALLRGPPLCPPPPIACREAAAARAERTRWLALVSEPAPCSKARVQPGIAERHLPKGTCGKAAAYCPGWGFFSTQDWVCSFHWWVVMNLSVSARLCSRVRVLISRGAPPIGCQLAE